MDCHRPAGPSRRRTLAGAALTLAALWLAPAPLRAQVQLLVTDNDGVKRYDFQSNTLTTLVPAGADAMTGVTIGPNGNLFVAGTNPGQVFQYNPATGAQIGSQPFVFYEGTPPTPDPHDVIIPAGLRFSPTNQNLYVADQGNSNVHVYSPAGASLGTVPDGTASLSQPSDVAFDAAGNLYVGNPATGSVLKSVDGTQPFTQFVGAQSGGLINPVGLTFGPDGKLYVLDSTASSAVYRYNADGSYDNFMIPLDTLQPGGLAFGPDGKLYVSGNDLLAGTGVVDRFLADGSFDTVVVSGLTSPLFMTFSPVPEPTSASLAGLAAAGLMLKAWRRRAKRS